MSKVKTLAIVVSLMVCVQGCTSSKKTKSSEKKQARAQTKVTKVEAKQKKAKASEPLIRETNKTFTTKVFGDQGPALYVVGWILDGGDGMRQTKDQLRIILGHKGSREVILAVEGASSGGRITGEYIAKWAKSSREVLQYANEQGVSIYGGENDNLAKYLDEGLNFIRQKGRSMKKVELCSWHYLINIIERERTGILLRTLHAFYTLEPDKLIIGMMEDSHFGQSDHDLLRKFAGKYRVRVVLFNTKNMAGRQVSYWWPQKKCGDMKSFKGKFKEFTDKAARLREAREALKKHR